MNGAFVRVVSEKNYKKYLSEMVLCFIGVYAINSLLLRNVSLVRATLEYKFGVSVRPFNILYGSMSDKLLPNFAAKFISVFILVPEKFLSFDWLRAEVFQLNLKYLHGKITVTVVTQNRQIISSLELRKNEGKISRCRNRLIQETKENSENQNTEKSTSTWLNVWTS